MRKRIKVIRPKTTVDVLHRMTTTGNRSGLIDPAVRQLVEAEGKATLQARLKQEALSNAERDLAMAAEWPTLEAEAAKPAQTRRSPKARRKRK
jgi:hypothetical protein